MTRQEYLQRLHEARISTDPWILRDGRIHRLDVDEMSIVLDHTPARTTYTLSILGSVVVDGQGETISLAKGEALQYAEHYVRTMIDATPVAP